jgi:hypothetical protein
MRAIPDEKRRGRGDAKAAPVPAKRRTRGLSKFKRTDLAKAAQAAKTAGLPVRGIEIDPATGRFTVLIGEPTAADGKELDTWLGKKNARPA